MPTTNKKPKRPPNRTFKNPVPMPMIRPKPPSAKKVSSAHRKKAQAKRKAAKGYQGPRLPELF